jgi:hypothetical protein
MIVPSIRESRAMPGFPILWNFPGFEQLCRAIPRPTDEEDSRRLVTQATGRTLD